MSSPMFPSTRWSWFIEKEKPIKITHPSGTHFFSPVVLTRTDRLAGKDIHSYNLAEKDVNLISYTIDYLQNKSELNHGDLASILTLSANLVSSYRFRKYNSKQYFSTQGIEKGSWRKFGEHYVNFDGQKVMFFVIGHETGTLIAVALESVDQKLDKFDLVVLPRDYFTKVS